MTDEVLTADLDLIKRIIPHRYPMLMIDRVEDIVLGKGAVGIKMVTANEPHFTGHFPRAPVMPGVLIIESMAQTASIMVGLTNDLVDHDVLVYFMSLDKCKFRRMVVPGDELRLEITTIRSGAKIWRFSGVAKVGDEIAAQAEFTAMIDDPTVQ
jgi:3-hydroxyacyl-[acyl-carrier-protein] dehydratase